MAGFYNRIAVVGNLTRDPEIRYLSSGAGVTKFTVAINRRTKQGDDVTYIDVVAWNKLGEICHSYLKKGASVLVEGRLAIRSYDDKDGIKRKAVEIVASDMQMLDKRPAGEVAPTDDFGAADPDEDPPF
ncbi:MAG TPA: single-stranded DNA-binding protein [Candidatus Acidoferrales bacterium]|nr:single-stranded DNA-binding protein [Candidatus Acidoferrales bacterium]